MPALERMKYHDRETRKALVNCVVKFSAESHQLAKAEHWMTKLNGSQGCNPEVSSFNALVSEATKIGNIDKAEVWFMKVADNALHPELQGMQPNLQSYNIMVQACAEAGDVARAEKYVLEAEAKNCRPALVCLGAVVRACIAKGEARRAHKWMESLVERGSCEKPSYGPKVVKDERETLNSLRTWDVDAYVSLVISLIKSLADHENTITANRWLAYLSECGLQYRESPEAWEYVRMKTPQEIVPAALSGECWITGVPMSPPLRRPVTLSGERRERPQGGKTKMQELENGSKNPHHKGLPDRPLSQASTRPDSRSEAGYGGPDHAGGRISVASWANSTTSRGMSSPAASRAGSPALRKLLDARKRGARTLTASFSAQ